jgi:hypothetical protein
MTTFVYPTALEIERINQVLVPNLMAQREIFSILPTDTSQGFYLEWEQEDNYVGLQQVRGLDGQPTAVKRTGTKSYVMIPGVYGEFSLIGERELTTRRTMGTFGDIVDITDLVAREDNRLLARQLDRQELIGWTLLSTGTFSVAQADGTVLHTDSYSPQTFSAAVAWSTAATSTPFADLRAIKLKQRGYGVRFDGQARAYMNATTANTMFANLNNADLYGRRTSGLGTFNSLDQVNTLLADDNLPQIVEYDNGYLDDSGTFQKFIPDAKVVVIGRRTDGAPIGNYRYVRNINNTDAASGPYMRVVDEDDEIPRHVEIHRGHNGGPVLYFPSAVVVASV